MKEYEPYSVRAKRAAQQGEPVTFQYDRIASSMKAHAYHAIQDSVRIAPDSIDEAGFWYALDDMIVREHGLFERLSYTPLGTYPVERSIAEYMQRLKAPELALDVVEMGLRLAQEWVLHSARKTSRPKREASLQAVVDKLNKRFRLHDLGFGYVGIPGRIIRVDSQYIHAAAVEPAIAHLAAKGWDGPLDEFMEAHKHYRHGNNKASINDALKSFESTMKAILDERGWQYDSKWSAQRLIDALFGNGLVPSELSSHFTGVRSTLESGVPTLRNRKSSHGQGSAVANVPEHLAAFALHLTASNIVFLLAANDEYVSKTAT